MSSQVDHWYRPIQATGIPVGVVLLPGRPAGAVQGTPTGAVSDRPQVFPLVSQVGHRYRTGVPGRLQVFPLVPQVGHRYRTVVPGRLQVFPLVS